MARPLSPLSAPHHSLPTHSSPGFLDIFLCFSSSLAQISVFGNTLFQAFLLMQSNIGEEEKEAQVEQVEEEETNGLARRDFFDRNIRDAQLSVDEIEVDVSDDGDGDLEGISKTIPASLLEEGSMEKLVLALDPPSPFALYNSQRSKKGSVYVEEAIVHCEDGAGHCGQQQGQRFRDKPKDDTDYETADELSHDPKTQEEKENQDKEKDHRPKKRKGQRDRGSEVKISPAAVADDSEAALETRKTKTPVASLIQKYNSIMKPSEDQNVKKANVSKQGNKSKALGVNRKQKYGQVKDETKDRSPIQKKVKAETNMSKVFLNLSRIKL